MASWCWICHYKVSNTYVYYKGDKCHYNCREQLRQQELTKPFLCHCNKRFKTQQGLEQHQRDTHVESNNYNR